MNEDRSASFVELFFDLVLVFGITQAVSSIHGHLDWPTLWRAAVVLLLLWWAWSQFVAEYRPSPRRVTADAAANRLMPRRVPGLRGAR